MLIIGLIFGMFYFLRSMTLPNFNQKSITIPFIPDLTIHIWIFCTNALILVSRPEVILKSGNFKTNKEIATIITKLLKISVGYHLSELAHRSSFFRWLTYFRVLDSKYQLKNPAAPKTVSDPDSQPDFTPLFNWLTNGLVIIKSFFQLSSLYELFDLLKISSLIYKSITLRLTGFSFVLGAVQSIHQLFKITDKILLCKTNQGSYQDPLWHKLKKHRKILRKVMFYEVVFLQVPFCALLGKQAWKVFCLRKLDSLSLFFAGFDVFNLVLFSFGKFNDIL